MGKKTLKTKKPKAKKPLKKKAPIKRRGLFDTFESVPKIRQGESLRFRDTNGRLTKFDGRKKLIAEIWIGNKRTNRVLNRTKKKQPVPQKFASNAMKKRILFSRVSKQGPRKTSEPKSKKFKIDSRFTIADNIEAKCPEIADDTVAYTKRGNGTYATIELTLKTTYGENFYEVISAALKTTSKQYVFLELARMIIHRLYRNEQRASNKDISPLGRRARYVRSFAVKITWDETKRLQEV